MKFAILGTARTPIGNFGGAFRDVRAQFLFRDAIKASFERSGLKDYNHIYDCVGGNAVQPSDCANITRVSILLAGFPMEIPAYTVMANDISSLVAITNAIQAMITGEGELYLVGGTESASTAPYIVRGARWGFRFNHGTVNDMLAELRVDANRHKWYCELVGKVLKEKYGIPREEMDRFAAMSHKKAFRALREQKFKDQITPVTVKKKAAGKEVMPEIVSEDEGINPVMSPKKAAKATPFFEGLDLTEVNTYRNADGAASFFIATEKKVKDLQLTPEAYIVGYGFSGTHPDDPVAALFESMKNAAERAGVKMDEIEVFELDETFAGTTLAAMKEFAIPEEKVNVWGGALALGHPIGAQGAIMTVKLVHVVRTLDKKLGMVSLTSMGGQAISLVISKE